jgi:hypothetical protein
MVGAWLSYKVIDIPSKEYEAMNIFKSAMSKPLAD